MTSGDTFYYKLCFLSYMTKNSGQKSKDLENEKSFQHEIKSIFRNFKGISVSRNFCRPEKAFKLLAWRRVYLISFELQLPNTSSNLFWKYLTKFY